ncbi:oxidoreductase [Streptomyces zinciresistens K42]|uniref:Oxidoreductase n=1 Tax=Streptomyces zinciresistens K42 TaxID=700597 RepID=G2GPP9_9ACTN|nr:CBS domain-containing protein [Streptomyces zinciresistens]EGX54515.1 oxidoreductase [Streptomyces zinciresistens K42]
MRGELVKDVMTPGVAAVRPGAWVAEAARLMRAQGVGEVVVADGQDVVGVLTDRDVSVRALVRGADPQAVSARSACTGDPVVIGPGERASAAVALMREHGVRRLPVVEDGIPVGVVTLGGATGGREPRTAPGA